MMKAEPSRQILHELATKLELVSLLFPIFMYLSINYTEAIRNVTGLTFPHIICIIWDHVLILLSSLFFTRSWPERSDHFS